MTVCFCAWLSSSSSISSCLPFHSSLPFSPHLLSFSFFFLPVFLYFLHSLHMYVHSSPPLSTPFFLLSLHKQFISLFSPFFSVSSLFSVPSSPPWVFSSSLFCSLFPHTYYPLTSPSLSPNPPCHFFFHFCLLFSPSSPPSLLYLPHLLPLLLFSFSSLCSFFLLSKFFISSPSPPPTSHLFSGPLLCSLLSQLPLFYFSPSLCLISPSLPILPVSEKCMKPAIIA